jgi:FKBP-type peptidyl-prolyl cis-trans isomerase
VRRSITHLVLLAALVALAVVVAGCTAAPTPTASTTTTPSQPQAAAPSQPQAAAPPSTAPASPGVTAPVTALKIVDKAVGTGAAAKSGDLVTVDYTGWLTDGTKFDSSIDSGTPFQFTLGNGEVIAGWDQGLVGMKVGGVRTLTIPPDLAYGTQGAGGTIPSNATLVFEVKLLKIN